jgi:predicted aspartyl protease/thioredoxin-like negative regulator of GroEL
LAAFAICTAFLAALGPLPAAQAAEKKRDRAEQALRNGEFEQAEKLYREMVAKDSRNVTARLGLSFSLLKQRKLQDAFDHAAHAITTDPASARGHAILGMTLLAIGDFRLSAEEFRTALSIRENEALAIAGLAMIDYYENRLPSSLNGLRRAVFLDPNEPDYVFCLAQAAARSERYREAADAYERFLLIAPRTDEDRRARIRGLIDFLRYLGTQRQLYTVAGPERVELPFEAVGGRPIIQVRINNARDPFRFVVDTGSGMTVISDHTAERLGLRPVARGGMARAVGGGGKFEIIYSFLQSLYIGEARVDNVPVYIRRFYNTQEQVDGYIGLSVMSKFLTTIDYGTRTFIFDRSDEGAERLVKISATTGTAAQPAPIEVPVRTTSSGFLSGEVRLEGVDKPLNFIIDTGASISVVSETLATREEMGRFAQKIKMRVYGAAGVAENVPALLLPRVALGAQSRSHITAVVLDLEPINETTGFEQTGIIGGNFLRHYRVTFDFRRAVMRLEPLTPVTGAGRAETRIDTSKQP